MEIFYTNAGLGGSVGCASDWRPGGRGFDPRRGRQHSFVKIPEILPSVSSPLNILCCAKNVRIKCLEMSCTVVWKKCSMIIEIT